MASLLVISQQWHAVKELALLSSLAEKHLAIKDLNAEPKLLAALKEAFSLGKASQE